MGRRILLLGALAAGFLASACNRPEGGWRNQNQDQAEPTQSGPVFLPPVQTDTPAEGDELLDQLEELLSGLDASLSSENEWELDVPEELGVEFEDEINEIAIDELIAQLEAALGTLDGVLMSETAQQVDPP